MSPRSSRSSVAAAPRACTSCHTGRLPGSASQVSAIRASRSLVAGIRRQLAAWPGRGEAACVAAGRPACDRASTSANLAAPASPARPGGAVSEWHRLGRVGRCRSGDGRACGVHRRHGSPFAAGRLVRRRIGSGRSRPSRSAIVQARRRIRSKPRADSEPRSRLTRSGCGVVRPAAATGAPQLRAGHLGVDPPARRPTSGPPPRPGPSRPARRPRPTAPPGVVDVISCAAPQRRERDLDVDPVEQRAGELAEVAAAGHGRALAVLVAGRVRARARIGGEHHLDPGRVFRAAPGAGQHAPGRSPAAGAAPAARAARTPEPRRGTAHRGAPVTARPGRARPEPPPTRAAMLALWCGAWNGGRRTSRPSGGRTPAIECRAVTSSAAASSSSGRIDGSRSASIVLPAPGGPEQGEVVPARGGDLEAVAGPSSCPATSARSGPAGGGRRCGAAAGQQRPLAADEGDEPVQRVDRPDGHAGHDGGLAGVVQRHDHPGDPGPGRRGHHRQHPADRADGAVEAQLAEHHDAVQRRRAAARRRRPAGRRRWRGRSRCRVSAGWRGAG